MATTDTSDKPDLKQLELDEKEYSDNASPPNEDPYLGEQELASFDRKMLFKLDLILVPLMAMLYLLAFLDRANIGNARVVSQTIGVDVVVCWLTVGCLYRPDFNWIWASRITNTKRVRSDQALQDVVC